MYILFGILIAICVFFLILNLGRRKKIIRKVCVMDSCEKVCRLNELIWPFGFSYECTQDIFSSSINAWQREFGYRALYDRAAANFNMAIDCEPVYFNYDNRTWLIEFWKGQYGINTGAEIGIYYADTVLSPAQYSRAAFRSVPDEWMLPLSMTLKREGKFLFTLHRRHWWLTGFRTGTFSLPGKLELTASVTFPDDAMMSAFIHSLLQAGYESCEICICGYTVSFTFTKPHTKPASRWQRLKKRLAQCANRFYIRLFRRAARPFTRTADQLLYLYYFLPFAFRHALHIRRLKRSARRKRL